VVPPSRRTGSLDAKGWRKGGPAELANRENRHRERGDRRTKGEKTPRWEGGRRGKDAERRKYTPAVQEKGGANDQKDKGGFFCLEKKETFRRKKKRMRLHPSKKRKGRPPFRGACAAQKRRQSIKEAKGERGTQNQTGGAWKSTWRERVCEKGARRR